MDGLFCCCCGGTLFWGTPLKWPQRFYHSFDYQSESWEHARRVVANRHRQKGANKEGKKHDGD